MVVVFFYWRRRSLFLISPKNDKLPSGSAFLLTEYYNVHIHTCTNTQLFLEEMEPFLPLRPQLPVCLISGAKEAGEAME